MDARIDAEAQEVEFERVRQFWVTLFVAQMREHSARIADARAGRKWITLPGGTRVMLSDEASEIAAARRYFSSRDARWIAANAGYEINVEGLIALISERDLSERHRRRRAA